MAQSKFLTAQLRLYPFFVVAAARWPTWEALAHFAPSHKAMNERAQRNLACDAKGSGVDWPALFESSKSWTSEQLAGFEPGEGATDNATVLKAAADLIYGDRGKGDAAQTECAFGFLFLCTTQVMAAAQRLTGAFEPWARAIDRMLAELPYFSVAGAGWPTFQMLAMFSSMSKGEEAVTISSFQADVHRWGGSHPSSKRFRQYGDLRLTQEELAPHGRNQQGWQLVDTLAELPMADWYAAVLSQQLAGTRRLYSDAIRAIYAVMRSAMHPAHRECGLSGISEGACLDRGCLWGREPAPPGAAEVPWCKRPVPKRKLVLVTFVWGERWAALIPRFAAWMAALRLPAIVVAMGDACRTACESAAAALGSMGGVSCWDPLRGRKSLRNLDRGTILATCHGAPLVALGCGRPCIRL